MLVVADFIYLPKINRIWIKIPKNASTAVLDAIRDSHQPWHQIREIPEDIERVALLRNPFKRMESAYRYFKKRNSDPAPDIPNPKNYSFSDWILTVCEMKNEERNIHIATQASIIKPDGRMPEHIVRWDFDELAKLLHLSKIEHKNETSKEEPLIWSADATEKFIQEYEECLKIWGYRFS